MEEIYILVLEQQRWSLEFATPFSKIYIWDLGLRFANSMRSCDNPNLVQSVELSGYISTKAEINKNKQKEISPSTIA